MRNWLRLRAWLPAAFGLLLAGLVVTPLVAQNQASDAMRQQVEKLVEQLKTNDPQAMEAAKQALMALDPAALAHIKEALATVENPAVQMALEEVASHLVAEQRRLDDERRRREAQRPAMPVISSITVSDGTGQYSMRTTSDGRVVATSRPTDGPEETREFESREVFEREWPEMAQKFSGFRFGFGPVGPRGNDPNNNDDGTREFPGPFRGPDRLPDPRELFPEMPRPEDFERQFDDLRQRTEELQRLLEELQNGGGDPENMLDRLRELFGQGGDPQRQAEREQQRRERQRRLDDLRNRQPDPLADPEGFARWMEEYMREFGRPFMPRDGEPGFPGIPGRPGRDPQPQPRDPERQPPHRENEDEEFLSAFGPSSPLASPATVAGVVFGPLTDALRAQLKLTAGQGVLATSVTDAGAMGEVQRFDVLLTVNDVPVASAEDVKHALNAVPAGAEFTVQLVRRNGRLQLLGIKQH